MLKGCASTKANITDYKLRNSRTSTMQVDITRTVNHNFIMGNV
jgi:uncharacterized lipoprotein YmbA